jgi:serine/threonine-protein kinase PpkA
VWLVHRDVKPENVFLLHDEFGGVQVKLVDFGIVKVNRGGATQLTAVGSTVGTPYYMSPEQAQGVELDERSDLYSLGVIFYEMLVGSRPYLGATAIEVLRQHVDESVPLLPRELSHHQAVIDGLMAKAPEDRYGSAQDLLRALALAA